MKRRSDALARGQAIWDAKSAEEKAAIRAAQARRVARRAELNASRDVVIYALTDPDGTPRYVGCTSQIERRLECHLAGGSSKKVSGWIAELKSRKAAPGLMIIAICHAWDGPQLEGYYLQFFGKRYPLLNTCQVQWLMRPR